jgi:protocatechuate 3,4-dioxygenase beta subunit
LNAAIHNRWNWSDSEGRYKLEGVSKSAGYHLIVQGGPFIRFLLRVNDTPGAEAITADVELQRGLEVLGRLIDKTTGRPVRGYVEYYPLVDNPNLAEFSSFTKLAVEDLLFLTRLDGSFSVPVLPGRGIICVHSWENRFTNGHSWPAASLNVAPFPWARESYHAVVEINVSEMSPESRTCEIALDPGRTLSGTVVDPDGEPLTGALAWGIRPAFDGYELDIGLPILRSANFVATGLDDRNPRYLLFWHKEKELAKAMLVWGDERGPLTVRLEPLGTIHGRLTDPDGKPLAGVKVDSDWYPSTSRIFRQFSGLALGNHLQELHWVHATTDSEGRFQMPHLIPGFSYQLRTFAGVIAQDLLAPTGQPKDLGTIKLVVNQPETKKP